MFDPVNAVFCVKERPVNGGVSGFSVGPPARRLPTDQAAFCGLGGGGVLAFSLPSQGASLPTAAELGMGRVPPYVPGRIHRQFSKSQDLWG